jgi:hypothetical protein
MPDVTLFAVLAATVAAFILSSTYYTVFASELAEVSDAAASGEQPPPWKLAALHGGDWLAKLLVVALIVSVWQ